MFDFVKKIIGGQGDENRGGSASGLIQAIPGGGAIVNLERCWWGLDLGGGGHLVVRSASGREVFSEEEHLNDLRANFLRLGPESAEVQALRKTLEHEQPLLVVFPSKPRIRGEAIELLDEFLKRRLKSQSTDFELFKVYTGPARPDGEKFCRKFRGKRGEQVVLNLSGEGLRYLHFDPEVRDVAIDALEFDWPVTPTPESLVELAEKRIRSMDPAYFRRLREGIDAGLLLVFLPERRDQRASILGTAGRLLAGAPGGGIDLDAPGVLRMYRTSRHDEG